MDKSKADRNRFCIAVLFLGLALSATLYASYVELHLAAQAVLGWLLVAVLIAVIKLRLFPADYRHILIIVLTFFVALRYWMFRTFDTLGYSGLFDCTAMSILYVAESYGFVILMLGMFVNVFHLRRPVVPVDLARADLPTVDILIPTFDEPEDLVKVTAMACLQLDYPKDKVNIFILDDGGTRQKRNDPDPARAGAAERRHASFKKLAGLLGVRYLTRENNRKAKAGNINNALPHGRGDLVLVLDCDHVPAHDLLKNTVGCFLDDPKLFLVQTPHFLINPGPVEKNLETFREKPHENEMFYRIVKLGLDFWDAAFFCGSAAVLRRSCLEEIGGITGETITEDAETSLALHARGYKSLYLDKPMVCGLAPETFDGYILQRSRWAQGMIQIFLLKNPLFLKGLTLTQRLCYLNSCFFWFFGLARLVFLLAPLAYLFFGLKIYNASLAQILAYTLPYLAGSYIFANHMYGKIRHPFLSELYETAQCFFLMPAVVGTLLRPRAPTFKVTPKGRKLTADFLSHLGAPFYVVFFLFLAAVPFAVMRWQSMPLEHHTIVVCISWVCYNFMLILLCLGVAWEHRQVRGQHRVFTNEPARIVVGSKAAAIEGEITDLSLTGFRFDSKKTVCVTKNEAIELEVRSSSGRSYVLPARIANYYKKSGTVTWGCRFTPETPEELSESISFMYGDSARWQRCWDARWEDNARFWSSFFYFLGKGFAGAHYSFAGIFKLTKHFFIKRRELWHRGRLHLCQKGKCLSRPG